jgi:hypothetical protein
VILVELFRVRLFDGHFLREGQDKGKRVQLAQRIISCVWLRTWNYFVIVNQALDRQVPAIWISVMMTECREEARCMNVMIRLFHSLEPSAMTKVL